MAFHAMWGNITIKSLSLFTRFQKNLNENVAS